jgi:superfamily I DNA/RNA helicase
MKFSPYQEAIFEAVKEPNQSLAVNAVAGSGKTTTTVEAVKFAGPGIFMAFNKSIQTELAARLPGYETSTFNSFGFRILRQERKVKMDTNKVKNILWSVTNADGKLWGKVVSPITKLISLAKANLTNPIEDLEQLCEKYDIELPKKVENFHSILADAWQRSLNFSTIDFDDQIFAPVYLNISQPRYANVFVDECQDFSPAQIELIMRSSERLVAVGDRRQAIYGFRGADATAFDEMILRSSAKELPLSVCYRCSKAVVREAKLVVPEIEWHEDSPEGAVNTVKTEELLAWAEAGDFVLCRNTAPLIVSAFDFIRKNKPVSIKGKEIGQDLISTIESIAAPDESSDDFEAKLSAFAQEKIEKLGKREEKIEQLQDKVDALRTISENSRTVREMIGAVNRLFPDNLSGIIHSTIHKSKGLEADRVFIIRPDLMPHPKATGWRLEQENNLKYVAITRARKELNYVS